MLRAVAAACVVLVTSAACSVRPFGASIPARVTVPNAVQFEWRGFTVHLEPTVLLWGNDAHIDVRKVVTDTLVNAEERLRASPTDIAVQAGSYRTIPDVGIGGFTDPTTSAIHITMDQRSPVGLRRLLTVWLPLSLAHELHHSKRIIDGPGYGETLLEAMVTEGSAESFVADVFPDHPVIPWVQPLTPSEERRVWELATGILHTEDYDLRRHETWFFGKDGLPRWAGYKIGYAIVQAYRKHHPDVSGADLATMPADEILEGSRYDPPT
jgi:hypothetical protein